MTYLDTFTPVRREGTPKLLAEYDRLYAPKPLATLSKDADWGLRFYRTRAEAGIAHFEFEKSPAPLQNYDREIGGFLAGFIPLAWYFLLIALGVAK
jgi:hypothetical protein